MFTVDFLSLRGKMTANTVSCQSASDPTAESTCFVNHTCPKTRCPIDGIDQSARFLATRMGTLLSGQAIFQFSQPGNTLLTMCFWPAVESFATFSR